jgi:hypothetical protein
MESMHLHPRIKKTIWFSIFTFLFIQAGAIDIGAIAYF